MNRKETNSFRNYSLRVSLSYYFAADIAASINSHRVSIIDGKQRGLQNVSRLNFKPSSISRYRAQSLLNGNAIYNETAEVD